MFSHEVTLAEGQGSQGATRAGGGTNSPSPGASAHISLFLWLVKGKALFPKKLLCELCSGLALQTSQLLLPELPTPRWQLVLV